MAVLCAVQSVESGQTNDRELFRAPPPFRVEQDGFKPQRYYLIFPSGDARPRLESLKQAEHLIISKSQSPDWFEIQNFLGETEDPGVAMRFVGRAEEAKDQLIFSMHREFLFSRRPFYLHQYSVELLGETRFDWKALMDRARLEPDRVMDLDMRLKSLLMALDEAQHVSSHSPSGSLADEKSKSTKSHKYYLVRKALKLAAIGGCLSYLWWVLL